MTTTPHAALLSRMHWLREETRRISNVTLAGNFTNPEDRAYWADRLKKLTTELSALESQTTPPAAPSQEPAVPQGWTDADSDAARLALELECLLLDTENLSVVSKWWASANEALELHRRRLATPAAPSQDPYKDSTPHLSEKEALR